MTAATVLIPTHSHVAPLAHAIDSVRAQTVTDIEVFVVRDGVGDATRTLVESMAADDERIRFFDFPKGERKGELLRHQALQSATGDIVAYLGDDDYWLPHHLAVLRDALDDADFAHTLHVNVDERGGLVALPADLEHLGFRQRMLDEMVNRFDLTFAGHTLDAYRRLPHGWRTTPPDFPWTDLYMWRQFLAEPWCRVRSVMTVTGLCTATHRRPDLTDDERGADLAGWIARFADGALLDQIESETIARFARDGIATEVEAASARRQIATLDHTVGELSARLSATEQALAESRADTARAIDHLHHAQQAMHDVHASHSWRVTAPLRALSDLVARRHRPIEDDS